MRQGDMLTIEGKCYCKEHRNEACGICCVDYRSMNRLASLAHQSYRCTANRWITSAAEPRVGLTLRRAQVDMQESGDKRNFDEQWRDVDNAVEAETRRGEFTGKHAGRGESSSRALPSAQKKKDKAAKATSAACEPEPMLKAAGPGATLYRRNTRTDVEPMLLVQFVHTRKVEMTMQWMRRVYVDTCSDATQVDACSNPQDFAGGRPAPAYASSEERGFSHARRPNAMPTHRYASVEQNVPGAVELQLHQAVLAVAQAAGRGRNAAATRVRERWVRCQCGEGVP